MDRPLSAGLLASTKVFRWVGATLGSGAVAGTGMAYWYWSERATYCDIINAQFVHQPKGLSFQQDFQHPATGRRVSVVPLHNQAYASYYAKILLDFAAAEKPAVFLLPGLRRDKLPLEMETNLEIDAKNKKEPWRLPKKRSSEELAAFQALEGDASRDEIEDQSFFVVHALNIGVPYINADISVLEWDRVTKLIYLNAIPKKLGTIAAMVTALPPDAPLWREMVSKRDERLIETLKKAGDKLPKDVPLVAVWGLPHCQDLANRLQAAGYKPCGTVVRPHAPRYAAREFFGELWDNRLHPFQWVRRLRLTPAQQSEQHQVIYELLSHDVSPILKSMTKQQEMELDSTLVARIQWLEEQGSRS